MKKLVALLIVVLLAGCAETVDFDHDNPVDPNKPLYVPAQPFQSYFSLQPTYINDSQELVLELRTQSAVIDSIQIDITSNGQDVVYSTRIPFQAETSFPIPTDISREMSVSVQNQFWRINGEVVASEPVVLTLSSFFENIIPRNLFSFSTPDLSGSNLGITFRYRHLIPRLFGYELTINQGIGDNVELVQIRNQAVVPSDQREFIVKNAGLLTSIYNSCPFWLDATFSFNILHRNQLYPIQSFNLPTEPYFITYFKPVSVQEGQQSHQRVLSWISLLRNFNSRDGDCTSVLEYSLDDGQNWHHESVVSLAVQDYVFDIPEVNGVRAENPRFRIRLKKGDILHPVPVEIVNPS
ncbi:MAG: hypothetical protein LAT57_11475 [Balneolales bacterium]|nr:hypothetical protein [Balneolales bacterium]